MNDLNQTPKLSQAGLSAVSNFFMDKIMALSNRSSVDYSIMKQSQIDALKEKAIMLIKVNPYSFFEIVTLQPKCEDIENIDYGIIVKNFEHYMENGQRPNKYRIVINPTWSEFTVYVRSIDDKFWTKP